MKNTIPAPVIAAVAELVTEWETHATLDSLFMYAGAPGDPPQESKHAKALAWLRRVNQDPDIDALAVLGGIIEGYMDEDFIFESYGSEKKREAQIKRLKTALAKANLQYTQGGRVTGAHARPSISLEEHIRKRDIESLSLEFDRAVQNIEASPRESLSAA